MRERFSPSPSPGLVAAHLPHLPLVSLDLIPQVVGIQHPLVTLTTPSHPFREALAPAFEGGAPGTLCSQAQTLGRERPVALPAATEAHADPSPRSRLHSQHSMAGMSSNPLMTLSLDLFPTFANKKTWGVLRGLEL